ncbi:MAG: phosphoglycerate kinase [Armatimonadota bacterium]
MNKKTVMDIDVAGKRVLVRVDFNVPMENGVITNDKRVVAALPTIKYLIEHKARVILCSHLGRPVDGPDDTMRLAPVAECLAKLIGQPVKALNDCIGDAVKAEVMKMQDGDVVMLENVRFYKEETKNEPGFVAKLADLAELYVNDAFGSAHRAHASTEGVAHHLPAVAGFLMQKELDYLGGALAAPKRPFVAILGGAKVADKISVIENLLTKVDKLIIGGGMAFTFLKAQGYEIGKSILDAERVDFAKQVLADSGDKIVLPVDMVMAAGFDATETTTVDIDAMPADMAGFDVGPKSDALFAEVIKTAGTVIWNGPMGVFEKPQFAEGTRAMCQALAESSATSIIGGGDSASAVKKMGYADKMTHISTGGGASLEFLEGKALPGVVALLDK